MSPERTRGVVELDAIRLHYVHRQESDTAGASLSACGGFVDAATIAAMTDGGKSPGS